MQANLTQKLVDSSKPKDKPYEIWDTTLTGLILRIEPSGSKTFYLQYRNTDKARKRIKLGKNPAINPVQARELAKAQLSDVFKGKDPAEERKKVEADNYLTFLESVYKPYLQANLRRGINNHDNVKETMDCLKNLFPEFHNVEINSITPQLIERWKQRRHQDGVKPSTINRQMNDLRACLNRAVKWGYLPASPFDKVELPKTDSTAKVRFLTEEEEKRLRIALNEREKEIKQGRERANEWRQERGYDLYAELSESAFADYLKPAVLLSINTGLRKGELLSLKWSEINFDRRTLTVTGDTAKDGDTRHVPLNDETFNILKQWKQQPGIKCQWVFHDNNGEPFQNIRKSWVAVLDKAKIADFRWHDLRHTFASKLVMAGVDLNTVRELLGHSDIKMTLRYAHLAPEYKAAAVARLKAVSI